MPVLILFLALAIGAPGMSLLTRELQNEKPVQSPEDVAVTKEFSDRIKAYVSLQKKLEGSLPGPKSSNDSGELSARAHALRVLIVESRANLQQGNIFTPDISAYFKTIIRKAFQESGSQARKTVQESDAPKPIVIRVNSAYPDGSPVMTTPPTLLSRLPELPMEVTYRIVGHSFVLLDNKTNLIVDFIPDAIP